MCGQSILVHSIRCKLKRTVVEHPKGSLLSCSPLPQPPPGNLKHRMHTHVYNFARRCDSITTSWIITSHSASRRNRATMQLFLRSWSRLQGLWTDASSRWRYHRRMRKFQHKKSRYSERCRLSLCYCRRQIPCEIKYFFAVKGPCKKRAAKISTNCQQRQCAHQLVASEQCAVFVCTFI